MHNVGTAIFVQMFTMHQDLLQLTKRESEVIRLLLQGKTNKEIADELNLSVNTVKTHLKNLFAKLKVNNRTQACIEIAKRKAN